MNSSEAITKQTKAIQELSMVFKKLGEVSRESGISFEDVVKNLNSIKGRPHRFPTSSIYNNKTKT